MCKVSQREGDRQVGCGCGRRQLRQPSLHRATERKHARHSPPRTVKASQTSCLLRNSKLTFLETDF